MRLSTLVCGSPPRMFLRLQVREYCSVAGRRTEEEELAGAVVGSVVGTEEDHIDTVVAIEAVDTEAVVVDIATVDVVVGTVVAAIDTAVVEVDS